MREILGSEHNLRTSDLFTGTSFKLISGCSLVWGGLLGGFGGGGLVCLFCFTVMDLELKSLATPSYCNCWSRK